MRTIFLSERQRFTSRLLATIPAAVSYTHLIFTPDGNMSAPYSKRHLVPFGEYLPYRRFFEIIFPALANSDAFGTDLAPGKSEKPLETPLGKAGVLICYESVSYTHLDVYKRQGLFTGTAANAHSVVHDDKAQYHASGKQRGGETLQHSDRRA